MSATGLEVFDKTLQTTHIWLNEIMDRLGPDRQTAWKALTAVLHQLRDRLPVELAAHLGAQLPMLVRGAYYDQFEPARIPSDCDTPEQFASDIAKAMRDHRPVDPEEAMSAVFTVLTRHLSEGQITKVRNALPKSIRMAWDSADTRVLSEAEA